MRGDYAIDWSKCEPEPEPAPSPSAQPTKAKQSHAKGRGAAWTPESVRRAEHERLSREACPCACPHTFVQKKCSGCGLTNFMQYKPCRDYVNCAVCRRARGRRGERDYVKPLLHMLEAKTHRLFLVVMEEVQDEARLRASIARMRRQHAAGLTAPSRPGRRMTVLLAASRDHSIESVEAHLIAAGCKPMLREILALKKPIADEVHIISTAEGVRPWGALRGLRKKPKRPPGNGKKRRCKLKCFGCTKGEGT